MDLVAEAEGEDGEEAQVGEVVLQLVLLAGDVGLGDGAAVGVNTREEGGAAGASEGVEYRGRGEVLDADLGFEAEVALGSMLPVPMVARGTTWLPPKVKTPVPAMGPLGLVTAL